MRIFPELTSAAFVSGVGLALLLDLSLPSAWPILLLALAGLAFAIMLRVLRLPVGPMLLAIALLLGAWRGLEARPQDLPVVPTGPAHDVTVAVTDAPVQSGHRIRFRGQVKAADGLHAGAVPAGTSLLIYALPPPELVEIRDWPYLAHGDRIRISGRLEHPQPIGDFDYAAWLASQQIPAILWATEAELVSMGSGGTPAAVLHRVRSRLSSILQRNIPAPQSGLAQALLLGLRTELPQDLKESFRTAGMSHLLAISGLHVGIVMAMILGLASAIAGRGSLLAFLAPALVVWSYAILSGLDPPVVRAAIMGSLVLAQTLLGRGMRGITALVLAAAVMVCAQPGLLGNLSFQLSFTAMAGVIVALPIITALTAAVTASLSSSGSWVANWGGYGLSLLVASTVISTTTTLATLPLVAMHFGAIPIMSVPATILAMPAMPAALVGAAATVSLGQIAGPLAVVLGTVSWGPLAWLTWVANSMPPELIPSDWLTPPVALAWYLALLLLIIGASSRQARWFVSGLRRRPHWRPGAAMALLVGLAPVLAISTALFAAHWSSARPDGHLHLYVLDVGQGDAILAVTPDGRRMLVDGGPDPASVLLALGRLLPVGERTLDVVAATHLDADHVGGLIGVLGRYDARVVLQTGDPPGAALYPQWQRILRQHEHPAVTVSSGHRINLGKEVTLDVLHPPPGALPAGVSQSANNRSMVMRLVYGEVSFLLTGDIEQDVERHLADTLGSRLDADVLKVGHHGSRSSTSPGFLRMVDPHSAAISAGRDNRYGHPVSEVMQRLEAAVGRERIFLTAHDGTIEYVTDGDAMWVKTASTPGQGMPR